MAVKILSANKSLCISSRYPTQSYTLANQQAFGRGVLNDEYRLLQEFPAHGLLPGSVILSAIMKVPKTTGQWGSNAGFIATAYRLTNAFATSDNWGSGIGYSADGAANADTGTGHSGDVFFDVSDIVEAWVAGQAQHGIMLRKNSSNPADTVLLKCALRYGSTITIDYLEPVSTFDVPASVAAGSAFGVTINRASSSFLHDIEFKLGAHTVTVTGAATSANIQTQLAHLTAIPSATSGTGTVKVTTKQGSTVIGSITKNITVTAPASVRPTFTSLELARIDGDVPSAWGIYVAGKSRAQLTINGASGAYGSTVTGRSITGAGQSGTASPWTTAPLSAGEHEFWADITDSRGRKSDALSIGPITVHPYTPPGISLVSALRCLADGTLHPDGTYIRCAGSYNIASCAGKNAADANIHYREAGSGTWLLGRAAAASGTPYIFGSGNVDVAKSYEVRFSVGDAFTIAYHFASIAPAARTINVRPTGKGVAFGKLAEHDNLVDSVWPFMYAGKYLAPEDGWVRVYENWIYSLPNEIYVAGDARLRYQRGDKIKLTQSGTVKYFYVRSVYFNGTASLLYVTGGNDYTFTNAAATDIYYSKANNPQGFPIWFSWVPTYTGFSTPQVATHMFMIESDRLHVHVHVSTYGVSNANSFRITLPPGIAVFSMLAGRVSGHDNSTNIDTAYAGVYGDTSIDVRRSNPTPTWTASGNKGAYIYGYYKLL